MLNGKICTRKLRYIVPLSFETEHDFETVYDEINNMTVDVAGEKKKMWEEYSVVNGEQDTFSYIVGSFYSESDKHNNIASAWSYKIRGRKNVVLSFKLRLKRGRMISAEIVDLHLLMFQTGIGMIWYEVDTDEELTADEWVLFQNEFKELARVNGGNFFLCKTCEEKRDLDSAEILESVPEDRVDDYIRKSTKSGAFYVAKKSFPFCGEECKDIKYTIYEHNAARNVLMAKVTYTLEKATTLGEWLRDNITDKLPYTVNFYPARKMKAGIEHAGGMIPDKALLFNYIVFNAKEQPADFELEKCAYYLTNGYKDSYVIPQNIKSQMFSPFGNAVWYAAKEGCGYYILADDSNIEFFSQNMKTKVMDDYFILYLLLLYQTYSVLHFANEIANDISANPKDYENDDKKDVGRYEQFIRENAGKLAKLRTQINLFMLKSVYTSVSHIHHQNSFYQYVEERLHIRDDLNSLTMGLEAIEELLSVRQVKLDEEARQRENAEREAYDRKMKWGMSIVSFFTSFNFINTCVGIWGNWCLFGEPDTGIGTIIAIIVGTVLVAAAWIWQLVMHISYKRKHKNDNSL